MDPLQALMTLEELPQDKLRMMAQGLRGRVADGGQLSVSAIPEIAAQGARMQNNAQAMARDIGVQQGRGLSGTISALQAAADMSDTDGPYNKITSSERKSDYEETSAWKAEASLLDTWSPEKQTPVLGKIQSWSGRMGIPLTQAAEEANTWWSQYAKWENQARNQIFGAALTEKEQAAWDRSSINPNMQPSLVDKYIKVQKAIVRKKAAEKAELMLEFGHSVKAVRNMMRGLLPEEAFNDLTGYISQQENEYTSRLKKLGKGGSSVQDMSTEDLLRALNNGQ